MTERKRPARRRGELRRGETTWADDPRAQEEALRFLLELAERYRASGRLRSARGEVEEAGDGDDGTQGIGVG